MEAEWIQIRPLRFLYYQQTVVINTPGELQFASWFCHN